MPEKKKIEKRFTTSSRNGRCEGSLQKNDSFSFFEVIDKDSDHISNSYF